MQTASDIVTEPDLLVRIYDAYSSCADLFQSHKECLYKSKKLARRALLLGTISSYYAGVCAFYMTISSSTSRASSSSTSSSSGVESIFKYEETCEEMCHRAITSFQEAKELGRELLQLLSKDAITPLNSLDQDTIRQLCGDVAYHLSRAYLKLFHLNPIDRSSSIEYSKSEANQALSLYEAVRNPHEQDESCTLQSSPSLTSFLEGKDDLKGLSSVDKRQVLNHLTNNSWTIFSFIWKVFI